MDIQKLTRLKDSHSATLNSVADDVSAINDLVDRKNKIDARITSLGNLKIHGGGVEIQIHVDKQGNSPKTVKELSIGVTPDDITFIDDLIALEENHLVDLDAEALVYESQADALQVL